MAASLDAFKSGRSEPYVFVALWDNSPVVPEITGEQWLTPQEVRLGLVTLAEALAATTGNPEDEALVEYLTGSVSE